MHDRKTDKITIIGCGLAGSFLAVLLAQKGFKIEIYERLDKNEICDTASKRSYNIVLFGYGISLLQQTDLWNDIKPYLLTLQGTVTHIAKNAKPVISLVDHKKMPYFTIARARLADVLLKKASRHSSVTIHYNTSLVSIDRHHKTLIVQNLKTKKASTVSCDVVIGADGTNSLVRPFLQQGQETNHAQEYAAWTYKQFILSPQTIDILHLKKHFVHVWTQKETFITMHPDSNDSLGALLVYPKTDENSKMLHSPEGIKKFIGENFPELMPALDEIAKSILANPEGNFATIHTDPWYYKDFIALIGDAAHGFYPFFGQGTSAAFADCIELIKLIDLYGTNWEKIFPLYQQTRKKHTDILATLSQEVISKYLRYKKADYDAIYDKLEFVAHRLFPKIIYPPLSESIIVDPGNAALHMQRNLKQKRNARRIGISFLVTFLTLFVTLYELVNRNGNSLDKPKKI